MAISALGCIMITDQDIDEIETLLGDITFDLARREIIKDLGTFDVQAFPGSGKTTVLIAKLAILAKKWPHTHKGICVLSHTNVAKDEIDRHLGQNELGRKLLSYPHFIGTLHSFCDTYLSVPWLKSKGYQISMIDTEVVLQRRWEKLKHGTRSYLQHSRKDEHVCEAKSFPVTIEVGCSPTSPTYQDIKCVVEESQRQGYFTFDEMLQIAKYVSSSDGAICKAIQERFPLLLIDEAQDTSGMQYDIISSVFSNRSISVMQSYGDANQAIFRSYGSEETNRFPSEKRILTIADSRRFDNTIAKLADSFAVSRKGMIGDAIEYSRNQSWHTVFLFEKNRIENVIQAYAEHVLSCFDDKELLSSTHQGCYLLGMVHNKEPMQPNHPHFPIGLRDYCAAYDPLATKANPQPIYLIDYFRRGISSSEHSLDSYHAIESVSQAFLRIIKSNSDLVIPATSRKFCTLLKLIPEESQIVFRKEMLELMSLPFATQGEWDEVVSRSKSILKMFFGLSTVEPLKLQWTKEELSGQKTEEVISRKPKNIFTYIDNATGRSVDIHLASIHSVKGQTHLATLVVETYWYAPNIKSIISCLCGTGIEKPNSRNTTRMKCHYVALTRARGLVCVALPISSVSDREIELLHNFGSNVVKV